MWSGDYAHAVCDAFFVVSVFDSVHLLKVQDKVVMEV